MEIQKSFSFEAAHFLASAPEGHPNARIHGHSFRAVIVLGGQPDKATGLIMDFADLTAAIAGVKAELDHQFLNEIGDLEFPTLEYISMWIWDKLAAGLPGLARVEIYRDSCQEACVYHGPGK